MMEHVKFALKVAVVILVINQLGPIKDLVNRSYFGGA
jgi:hypothetical protein